MDKASASGLFEVWAGCVVEGDCVRPSVVRWVLAGIFPTSEAVEAATESQQFYHCEMLQVRAPKAYVARMEKLQRIHDAKAAAWSDANVPF